MTDDTQQKYVAALKKAWAVYTALVVVLLVVLVLFVAQDNEERLFYALMGAAACYVFRPTEKFMNKMVSRFVDIPEKPEQPEKPES